MDKLIHKIKPPNFGGFFLSHHAKFSKYGWLVEVLKLIDERPRVRTFCYAVLFVVAIGVVLYTGAMFVEAMAKLFA